MKPSDETNTQIWLATAMVFLIIAAAFATHFRPPDTSGEHVQVEFNAEPPGAEPPGAELHGVEPPRTGPQEAAPGCDLLEDMCHETCAHVALPYLRYVEHGCVCGGSGIIRFVELGAQREAPAHETSGGEDLTSTELRLVEEEH